MNDSLSQPPTTHPVPPFTIRLDRHRNRLVAVNAHGRDIVEIDAAEANAHKPDWAREQLARHLAEHGPKPLVIAGVTI